MIRAIAQWFKPADHSEAMRAELAQAEAELRRSREEHAHSVNQRIDLDPLIAEAKQVACQSRATLQRNGWTDYLLEQMAGKKQ